MHLKEWIRFPIRIELKANKKKVLKMPYRWSTRAWTYGAIKRELHKLPANGWGNLTGYRSNLTVLDIDEWPAPGHFLRRGYRQLIGGQDYLVARSLSGRGCHFYSAYTPELRNRAVRKLKLDVKSDGGFVIAAESPWDAVEKCKWLIAPISEKTSLKPVPREIIEIINKSEEQPAPQQCGAAANIAGWKPICVNLLSDAQISLLNSKAAACACADDRSLAIWELVKWAVEIHYPLDRLWLEIMNMPKCKEKGELWYKLQCRNAIRDWMRRQEEKNPGNFPMEIIE